jgi:hypothetical protein
MPGRRLDGREDAVEIGEIRGVALDRRGIAADRGDCLIQLGLTAAGDEHPRAFLREPLGDAESDAGAAAGVAATSSWSFGIEILFTRWERPSFSNDGCAVSFLYCLGPLQLGLEGPSESYAG